MQAKSFSNEGDDGTRAGSSTQGSHSNVSSHAEKEKTNFYSVGNKFSRHIMKE